MNRNILDKSVQASVQRAIDNDQLFSLKHISQLKELIRLNITVIIDPNTSQNYSCMTLIQYSIKQNKPDALEYLLNVADESGMQLKDILRSNFKYENNNLLFLAVDFNSNSCLKTLIAFCKRKDKNFSVDISDPFGESPLTRAIKLGNEEAISILLSNGADLFYFDGTKNKLSTFMPILCIFFYNKEEDKLKHIFNECIVPNIAKEGEKEEQVLKKIIKDFLKMYFTDNFLKVDQPNENSKKIIDLFGDKNLTEAREYLLGFTDISDDVIPIIQQQSDDKDTSKPNIKKTNENQKKSKKCYFCASDVNLNICPNCGINYCNGCESKHLKQCSDIQNKNLS